MLQVTELQYGTDEGGAESALHTFTIEAFAGTPVTAAENVKVSFVPKVKLVGVMVTRTPESSVTVAEPTTVVSDCKVAMIVIGVGVGGDPVVGTVKGAVYSPVVLMVPTVVLPFIMSLTDQLTAPELLTVAVNCVV